MENFVTEVEPLFDLFLKHSSKHKSITVKWDPKLKIMTALSDSKLKIQRYKSYCYNVSIVTILIQILTHDLIPPRKKGSEDIFAQMLQAYAFIALSVTLAQEKVSNHRTSELITYVNGLFSVTNEPASKKQKDQLKPNTIQKINILYAWGLFIFLNITPAAFISLHWNNPCKGAILAWRVLPECYIDESVELGYKFLLQLFMGTTKFGLLFLNFLIYTHGLTDSRFKETNSTKVANTLAYRKLQLLTTFSNLILQNSLLSVVLGTMYCVSVSITVLIQLELTSKNLLPIAYFAFLGWNCILFLTLSVGGPMVTIYLESKQFLLNCKRHCWYLGKKFVTPEQRLTKRWLQKFYKSCPPIKFKLGGSNFLEELTSLKCVDCAIQITIQILLLTK
ncbi:unnamed protein product [Orchesella dallaii]|uniref:Gustatory receptor n=1 Tax=Orchesella dallaii TaxID=48710 RepID=A0ABP1PKL0_9HEXA